MKEISESNVMASAQVGELENIFINFYEKLASILSDLQHLLPRIVSEPY